MQAKQITLKVSEAELMLLMAALLNHVCNLPEETKQLGNDLRAKLLIKYNSEVR